MSDHASAAAAPSSSSSEAMETESKEETSTSTLSTSPKVVWSSGPTFAAVAGSRQRSSSRASSSRTPNPPGPGGKRASKDGNGPPKKKTRVFYDYKINIWNKQGDLKSPISLAHWRIMNVKLCTAAARKMVSSGPPKGGVGQKHWQEHSDGTKKTSELPDEQRFGHTVIRFSTIEAQEWYQPLVDQVLGTAQNGQPIQLITETEGDDDRARYVFSLPAADFQAFGKIKEEREDVLKSCILAAIESPKELFSHEDCPFYSSFLHQEKNKEDMWKAGMKFPTLLETKLDALLQGEKFGILPTGITGLRVLKKQGSGTKEERISRQLKKTNIGTHQRAGSTDSVKRARSSSSGRETAPKKVADGPTPDKI